MEWNIDVAPLLKKYHIIGGLFGFAMFVFGYPAIVIVFALSSGMGFAGALMMTLFLKAVLPRIGWFATIGFGLGWLIALARFEYRNSQFRSMVTTIGLICVTAIYFGMVYFYIESLINA